MKTHSLIRLLPCTLLLAGGLSFTACSDDDDTSSIPDTELTDTESATAQELSRLLGMLCEDEELSTGWATHRAAHRGSGARPQQPLCAHHDRGQ